MNKIEKKQLISLESVAVVSSELVSANLDGEVVILGFKSGSYYSLDQVGSFIWELLRGSRSVAEIRDSIIEEYDVEPAECERDLISLLQDLADKQLIEINNGPGL
jgi:hypothetical protein